MAIQQDVHWGEHLILLMRRSSGGIKGATARIQSVTGKSVGTRNTFSKLYKMTTAPEPGSLDHERACLLVWAGGADPLDFGLDPASLPPVFRQFERLLDDTAEPTGAYPSVLEKAA